MKNQLNKILAVVVLLFVMGGMSAYGQVTPATPNVVFFCNDAADLDLGASPAIGINPRWIVRHSLTPVATEDLGAITPIVLTGNLIPAASLVTGYLYITSISDESCESEPEMIPIYKFAALAASITGADDYCEEDPKEFTATATTNDEHTDFAYQWYTFENEIETAITGATDKTYTPTGLKAGDNVSYKVRIGYLVGTNKYCSNLSAAEEVSVTAKPSKPTITVEGAEGETW